MKIRKLKRIGCTMLSMSLLLSMTTYPAYADKGSEAAPTEAESLSFSADTEGVFDTDRKFKTTIKFESYSDEDTGYNPLTETIKIGDREYVLNSIENLTMVDARTPARRTLEKQSEIFVKGAENDHLPEDKIQEEGITWTLTHKELIDQEIEDEFKDAVATKRYLGVEKGVPIPQTIDYEYEDLESGQKIETTLPLTDQSESGWYWTGFEFPITISGYDADILDLNGTEIKANEPLINYADEFLDMLGLNQEYYEIDMIEWDGEPYDRNGDLCRNAIGSGKKYVVDIDAVYSGKVALPHKDGAAWKCLYTEELTSSNSTIYTYTADAVYVSSSNETPFGKILGFISAIYHSVINAIMEHPVIAALQMILVALLITIFLAKKKKKCIYDASHGCSYKQKCDNCPYYKILAKDESRK